MSEWVKTFRNIYRLALWVSIVLGSLANEYLFSILCALLLAVLHLEEISEQLDQ